MILQVPNQHVQRVGEIMTKEEIFRQLKAMFPEQKNFLLEKVTADIFYSGEPEVVLGSGDVLKNLFERWQKKHDEKIEAQKASVSSIDYCPICRIATAPVKLAEDRDAKWCSRHFVVFPIKGTSNV